MLPELPAGAAVKCSGSDQKHSKGKKIRVVIAIICRIIFPISF